MNIARVQRLLQLLPLLRSSPHCDRQVLATHLGVSRRTLLRDIQVLKGAGVPCQIEPVGDNNDADAADFFVPPLHFDLEEALAMLLVTRKFLSRQTHPAYQRALEAALKIESNLPASVLRHCGNWLDGVSVRWAPSSPTDGVADLLMRLLRAVAQKRRIQVRYDSVFEGREINTLLEPLRLVFIERGWYLIAKSLNHGEVRTFKVDRILDLQLTEDRFRPDPEFSEKKYFGAAWRMIPEGRVYPIRLRFAAAVAPSIEEVHWHDTQVTTRLEDGRLLFEAQVDGLREIASWVLSYGDQVEVLEPAELRDLVRQKAERVVASAQALDRGEA